MPMTTAQQQPPGEIVEKFMRQALDEARSAARAGDVPVGCVVVCDSEIVGRGRNRREAEQDPTAHAEIIALRQAAGKLGTWRLDNCDVFVTLEPCPMCAGALVLARVRRLYYGARDPKAGACGSLFDIVGDERLNHRVEVFGGVLAEECGALLAQFFRQLRAGA